MTGSLVPTLVRSLALPARSNLARSTRTGPRRPLPVARLIGGRERSTVYGLTAVDARGRIADRAVTRALGWQPGYPVSIRVTDGLIIVTAADDGQVAVSRQGRVHLPAAARHACGITPGDRILLAAEPANGVLVVRPLAALDAMVPRFRHHVMAGEAA
jgi:hypothetical protein